MPCKANHVGNALLAATLAASLLALALPASAEEDVWPALKQVNFGDRAIQAEDGKVVLDAPVTALDASLVPLTVRVPPEVKDKLKSLTLIIDKNPTRWWRKSSSDLQQERAASARSRPACALTRSHMFARSSRPRTGACT